MATTFTYNGIEFSVPTDELGEALRQLGVAPSMPSLSGMGALSALGSWNCAGVQRELTGWGDSTAGLLGIKANADLAWGRAASRQLAAREHAVDARKVIRFLKIIEEMHSSGGAPVEFIMDALGAQHAKGVGSKMAKVNEMLNKLGFAELQTVYVNPRDSLGIRTWKAGPLLREALQKLESEVAAA